MKWGRSLSESFKVLLSQWKTLVQSHFGWFSVFVFSVENNELLNRSLYLHMMDRALVSSVETVKRASHMKAVWLKKSHCGTVLAFSPKANRRLFYLAEL